MTQHKLGRTVWIILVALIVGVVVACEPTIPKATPVFEGPTPTLTVPVELPVVISIAGGFTEEELAILDEQIAAFEDANPDVMVEIVDKIDGASVRRPDARHKRFADLLSRGDSSLDILVLAYSWLSEFTTNGWLTPLDNYVKSQGVEMDDFLPATVEASVIHGQIVALPWLADGGLLYYRQDLLDKHGYAPPVTWADLYRISLEIKNKENLPYGFVWQGAAYESLTCNTLEFVWAYGGDVLDEKGNVIFDSAETRSALQQMADSIILGVSPPEVATYREATALAAFQRGDAIFMRNGSYAWDRLNRDDSPLAGRVGVAPLPASCLDGQSLALSAYSLHPDKAFRFMAFLVGYDQQVQVAIRGAQPPALETVYHSTHLLTEHPFFGALHTALLPLRPPPKSAEYLELSEAIFGEVNKMLLGKQSAGSTAAGIQHRLETFSRSIER